MTTAVQHHADPAHHGAPPRKRSIFMRPNLLRAAWCAALFFVIGLYIVAGIRWLAGWDPVYDWEVIALVSAMVTGPIGFLLGLGAFDYWLYWISGRPTLPEDHSSHGATNWKDYFRINTDHKVIGVQYTCTTFFFFAVGGLLAMFFRAELAEPGLQFFDAQTFNSLVSVHATLLIFTFLVPVFAGLGNFVIPLMIGAPDMAFPRLNALSYWLLPIAGVLFMMSFLAPGGAFATGWTSYAPLASDQPYGQVFFNMGVQWAGASSILTALNFLVTIITMRAPGMSFWRMPLLVWANFTTSLLVVLATPFIAGAQFFVMFDRVLHTSFFTPDNGGYALGYQHIFWFYSHPAVYIMILPGFGIISEIISTMSRKPIFGYRLMAISLVGILVLGFSVWAHHLYVAGMADWLRVPMMISTLLIAVPTGVKIFSWLATIWGGKIHLATPMLFALGFHQRVRDRWALGHLPGLGRDRHPRLRHVLRRRAHPLRVLRRLGDDRVRRDLLLVPEDDRADVQRDARQAPLLADVRRAQRDVLPDALRRTARDAAPRVGLLRPVRRHQHVHLDRVLRPRREHADLLLQHDHELGPRQAGG